MRLFIRKLVSYVINNKGFSKFEIIVVLLVIIVVMTLSLFWILKPASKQQIEVMKRDALVFSNTVVANISSFRNTDVVYLDEVIEEKVLKEIKNPFGNGSCDITESKVSFIDGMPYSTLKCGSYLIDNTKANSIKSTTIYKVSGWSNDIIDKNNVEEKVLFNCKKNDKDVFDNYYEEEYFLYKYNMKFGRNITSLNDISKKDCRIVATSFYREKDKVKDKS